MGARLTLCSRCKREPAVVSLRYAKLNLCKNCFIEFLQKRVARTIKEFGMFNPERDYILVALSGGKDSAALLHILKSLFPEARIEALYINMGIAGYSDQGEAAARKQAEMLNVKLHVYDLRIEDGISIDVFEESSFRGRVCVPCSTIRRRTIDKVAVKLGANVILTGHNLDDFLAIATNLLFNGDLDQLARLRPVQEPLVPGYPRKARPLIKVSEYETKVYARETGLSSLRRRCPHAAGSTQEYYKRLLDALEKDAPGFKLRLLSSYLKLVRFLASSKLQREEAKQLRKCRICGLPSENEVCSACARISLARAIQERLGIMPKRPVLVGDIPCYEPTRIST